MQMSLENVDSLPWLLLWPRESSLRTGEAHHCVRRYLFRASRGLEPADPALEGATEPASALLRQAMPAGLPRARQRWRSHRQEAVAPAVLADRRATATTTAPSLGDRSDAAQPRQGGELVC
ncbi:hypothetical protein V5799_024131 [Amblyomma americanum]|uniref:Uncharacterized protein n=1 Tax=Amblyomma americanum TaxID=6943 RepID=A0AAQ4ED72_AMBAM